MADKISQIIAFSLCTAVLLLGCKADPSSVVEVGDGAGIIHDLDRIGTVDPVLLKRHVDELTRHGARSPANKKALKEARIYIMEALRSYGYTVELEQFSVRKSATNTVTRYEAVAPIPGQRVYMNVIGSKGWAKDAPIIEIGAHYDSVAFSPGADDNASGTAAALEVARLMSKEVFDCNLRFCFFTLEEVELLGSRYHVSQLLSTGEQSRFRGIIVCEMLGYSTSEPESQKFPALLPRLQPDVSIPDRGNFVAFIGNLKSEQLASQIMEVGRRHVPEQPLFSTGRIGGFLPDAYRSDHGPYWLKNLTAVMLTDTADFRNPHYHKASDTSSTLDFGFLGRNVRLIAISTYLFARDELDAYRTSRVRQER